MDRAPLPPGEPDGPKTAPGDAARGSVDVRQDPVDEPAPRDGRADGAPAGGLLVTATSVGPMDNNAYLLICARTGERLLIDAAADPERLLGLLRGDTSAALPPPPTAVLGTVVTTHRHRDHLGALAAVVEATGAICAAGGPDAEAIEEATGVVVDRRLSHGDVLAVGDARLEVIALRGHTPGSIALAHRDPGGPVRLFTGDSLFPGGPGRTLTPEDFTRLMDDLESRVFAQFDDDTVVHPGHGASTTLGVERPQLPVWRARGW